jgi:putative ABC transport system ATP-binding protein
MLELRDITKVYGLGTANENYLFNRFNLTIQEGDFISVVGSNGSGKTSLLNVICGSIDMEGGQVILAGKDITKQADFRRYEKIGRVYQDPSMGTCPQMTILENMSLADNKNKPYNLRSGTDKKRIEVYRDRLRELNLGLEDKLDVKVGSLSGGQRQAIALLMSVLTPVEFLILDEHTASLDPATAELIMQLTEKIVIEHRLTTVMVTHNLRYALEYGNRLLMLHQGASVIDIAGEEKENAVSEDIMRLFNRISLE